MVGDGGKGGEEDGVNGAVAGYSVHGSCEVSVIIWEQELGGDGGHAKINTGITS